MKSSRYVAITLIFLTLATVSFAARIPTVGSDTNTWGTVLNEYLQIEHGPNGTHTNITAFRLNASTEICIGLDCRSSWPAGGGSGGGNASASGGTGWLAYFLNNTHLVSSPIFTDNTSIGIGTASPNAKLTVTGTNNANNLSLNVNNTLYVNASNNYVGIGTASPQHRLDINGTPSGMLRFFNDGAASIRTESYRDSAFTHGEFASYASRGTKDSPLGLQKDDQILLISGLAHNGTNFGVIASQIAFVAAENATTTRGAYMQFLTTRIGTTTLTERMRITDAGSIGIGAITPDAKLHVNGTNLENNLSLNINNTLYVNASNGTRIGVGTSSPGYTFHISQGSLNTILALERTDIPQLWGFKIQGPVGREFNIRDLNAATDRFTIDTSGRVGIGTQSPGTHLSVVGDGVTIAGIETHGELYDNSTFAEGTGGRLVFTGAYNSNGNAGRFGAIGGIKENSADWDLAGALVLYSRVNASNLTERVRIDSLGRVGIGTTNPTAKLEINGTNPVNNLSLNVNNTLYVNASTNRVGIGTANPLQKLTVVGTINFTDAVLANNCADGQVLKWSGGLGTCGTDSTGGDGGGNATASGATGYIPKFANDTHLGTSVIFTDNTSVGIGTTTISARLVIAGIANVLSLNVNNTLYVNSSASSRVGIGTSSPTTALDVVGEITAGGTVFSAGINITGRQIADNTTTSNRIGTLDTRESANNATQSSQISNEITLQAANNATQSTQISNEVTLQAANNATQSTQITNLDSREAANNATQNALIVTKLNAAGGTITGNLTVAQNFTVGATVLYADQLNNRVGIGTANPLQKLVVAGTANVTDVVLANNCADGQILKWSGGVGVCGTDSTSGGISTAGGWTNDSQTTVTDLTVVVDTNVFVVNTSTNNVGIGTLTPLSRLHIAGNVSIDGTLFIEGINFTARQIADNSTTSNRIGTLDTRETANNATQSTQISNEITLQAANNATQDAKINANNATLAALIATKVNNTGGIITGTINVTNLTVHNLSSIANCDVKADSTGTIYCGTDANSGGDGGGNASASGATGRLAYFFNNTHLLGANSIFFDNTSFGIGTAQPLSLLHVAGNVSINGTLFVEGVNVTGRQIADNSTISNRIGTLDTRESANNATQSTKISDLDTREAANNATQSTQISNEITLQAANNATQDAKINANNATLAALIATKVNNTGGTVTGTLNVTNLTIHNLSSIANCDVKADSTGTVYCGTDANSGGDGGGNATASGGTGYIAKFVNDTHLGTSVIFTDNTSIGIGTTSITARLVVAGTANVLSLNVNNTLYVNSSTSNVGIGTSSPTTALDVVGAVTIGGTLTVQGINVTGRQIADNTTIANNLSSLNDRINNEVTLQAANNATQEARMVSLHSAQGNLSGSNNWTGSRNFFAGVNITNLSVGILNSANCDVKAMADGTVYCGTDSTASDGGGNATASGGTGYISKFVNDTHIVSSIMFTDNTSIGIGTTSLNARLVIAGTANVLSLNVNNTLYVNSSTSSIGIGTSSPSAALDIVGATTIGGTLTVQGINVTGRQIADNTTIANNLSSLNDRINNEITLQAANNATQDAKINANNATLTALIATKVNNTGGIITGTLNMTNLTVHNLSSIANCDVKADSTGTVYCGTDATGASAVAGWTTTETLVYNNTPGVNVSVGTSNSQGRLHVNGSIYQDAAQAPRIVGYKTDPRLANARSVYVSGKYAYVSADTIPNSRIVILDVSNPTSPDIISNISNDARISGAENIFVSGKYAYVSSYVNDSLTIIDISNISSPSIIGHLTNGGSLNGAYSVYVSGKYAYVATTDNDSLSIIDISNPLLPSVTGFITSVNLDGARGVYVQGKYAYVAAGDGDRLSIVDISNSTSPTIVSSITDTRLDGARGLSVSGKYAYVSANVNDSLSIVDVSNSTSPVIIGAITDVRLDNIQDVFVADRYAYAASQNNDSFSIIDISTPSSPSIIGYITDRRLDGASDVYVSGKYAYVTGNSNQSLSIIDIGGIDSPAASIGAVATGSLQVTENAVVANDLYVGTGISAGPMGIASQGPLSVTGSVVIIGGTDSIALNVNNTLYVNTLTNRVGIGTSSPAFELDVKGNVNASAFITNGTDYAEIIPKLDENEVLEAGDVVEVIHGKVTKSKDTRTTGIYLVVTDSAGVLGNSGKKGVPVAFIGQVKVKVVGKVTEGDYILPSGRWDGTAIAVSRKDMTLDKFFDAIGKAIESKDSDGIARVLVAVGVK